MEQRRRWCVDVVCGCGVWMWCVDVLLLFCPQHLAVVCVAITVNTTTTTTITTTTTTTIRHWGKSKKGGGGKRRQQSLCPPPLALISLSSLPHT